jgi:RNA polymerase sigma factor (sigma-70 family)
VASEVLTGKGSLRNFRPGYPLEFGKDHLVEASAIPASVGLTRTRIAIGVSLLRIRTDDQLVTLFREGNDEAFRVIHDRYRARMLAYARQMLGASGKDPEDAVQEMFMRAYHGLRASDRQLALRAWLYRIAHNRCIDDLRRPQPLAMATGDAPAGGFQDPVIKVEQRDALRRLIADVQQLPGQQRSALLMRELSGMSYSEVAGALGVTVPAVKSLLVRARVGLAQASEARNTACSEIRADLIVAHDRGVRTSGLARRHLRECPGCREFRTEVRGVSRQLAVLTPTLGPLGLIANLLGLGGGGGGAAAGGTAVAASGSAMTAGGSAAVAGSAGLLAGGAGHVATLLAAAVVTAGGAVEIQSTLSTAAAHRSHPHSIARASRGWSAGSQAVADPDGGAAIVPASPASGSATGASRQAAVPELPAVTAASAALSRGHRSVTPITMLLDPDMYSPQNLPPPPPPSASGTPNASGSASSTSSPSSAGTPAGATGPGLTGTGTGDGSAVTSGPGTGSASATAPAASTQPSSATDPSSTATASGSSSSGSTTASATGSSAGAGSGSSSTTSGSTGSTSVGKTTTSVSSGRVVSFIAHRRTRGRRLDFLVAH